jgi:hypothetical protein
MRVSPGARDHDGSQKDSGGSEKEVEADYRKVCEKNQSLTTAT